MKKFFISAFNYALQPNVQITVSMNVPTGGGSRDPRVLLNETAHQLDGHPLIDFRPDRTYDTYDGQNRTSGFDWYAFDFGEMVTINSVEMTMGCCYSDGGWWTSLAVEAYRAETDTWHIVEPLTFSPPYNFEDMRENHRPFSSYLITFSEVRTRKVRLIGKPGGIAQFTSLSRLAVFLRDPAQSQRMPERPPVPYIFQLIPPDVMWDLTENLGKLMGASIDFPALDQYLDNARYQQYLRQRARNYQGEPDLWFLIGDTLGWNTYNALDDTQDYLGKPHIRTKLHGTLATAFTDIAIDDQVLGQMSG